MLMKLTPTLMQNKALGSSFGDNYNSKPTLLTKITLRRPLKLSIKMLEEKIQL